MYTLGGMSYVLLDTSFITLGIIFLYLSGNFILFTLEGFPDNKYLQRINNWIPATLVSLGLLGTVVGFFTVFNQLFAAVNFADPATMQTVLTQVSNGFSIAIISTIAGIITSIMVSIKNIFHAK